MKTYPELKVKNSGYINLPVIIDSRDGHLCVLESMRNIPFEIKRVYFITHLENNQSIRGEHAHKTLRQVIFCINGFFSLTLDDGNGTQTVDMWKNNVGVVLGPRLWHTMHNFASGTVLMVVASDYYDENDYIRNYKDFIDYIK